MDPRPDLRHPPRLRPLPAFIFASRWLQLPLYLGLIVAQCIYVFHFWVELVHLVEAAFGDQARAGGAGRAASATPAGRRSPRRRS